MRARPEILAIIVFILILTGGCLDVAVTSSVNGAGEIEQYRIGLSMTGTVYSLMNTMAKNDGYTSFQDMLEHPRDAAGGNPGFDYREEWDHEADKVTITATAKNPNAMRDRKSISIIRDGDYLIYREDMSGLAGNKASSQTESPYASTLGNMFTVSYTLTMPGEIVESNADTTTGTTARWHRSTSAAPMIYAKSKVPAFPWAVLAGAGIVIAILLVAGGLYLRGRARASASVTGGSVPSETTPRSPDPPVAVDAPRPVTVSDTVTYTPTRRPDTVRRAPVRTAGDSERVLRYVLIGGAALLALLIAGAMVQMFLDDGASPAPTTGAAPAGTTAAVLTLSTTTPAQAAVQVSPPLRIAGTGDDVAVFSTNGADLRTFAMQHTGSSWFFADVVDASGQYFYLASELGQYSGRTTSYLTAGQYTLRIRADGPWSVDISPAVALVSGPSQKSAPAQPATPVPTQIQDGGAPDSGYVPWTPSPPVAADPVANVPQPRYQAGDIINDHLTNDNLALLILSYDPRTDEYNTDGVFRYDDGHWGYRLFDGSQWLSRSYIDETHTIYITHVDAASIPIDPETHTITTPPTIPTPPPTPTITYTISPIVDTGMPIIITTTITPPTDPPTQPPTDPPTQPPTDPPTQPPTDPPTQPPPDPPAQPPTTVPAPITTTTKPTTVPVPYTTTSSTTLPPPYVNPTTAPTIHMGF